MKPLNKAERTTQLWKFTLLYIAALAIPLVAAYYLFADKSIAAENTRLKQELAQVKTEQGRLLTQMDTLTSQLQRIDLTDRQMRTESNDLVLGELAKRTQDNLNGIALALSEVRRDSARMQTSANKLIAQNVLRDFDSFRNSRNTIDFLRQQLTKRGVDLTGREQLAVELAQTKQLLATFQAAAANRPVSVPSGGGGGGGGRSGGGGGGRAGAGAGDLAQRLQASQEHVALLNDQVAFSNADCLRLRSVDKKAAQQKEMLEQARKGFLAILQNPSSEDMKASVEKMIDAIDKDLGRKRGLFR